MIYLGACYAAGGNDKEATGAWRTAMIKEGDALPLHTLLADALLRQDNGELALETLDKARARWPDDDGIKRRFVLAALIAGEYADGLQTLDELVERHVDDEPSLAPACWCSTRPSATARRSRPTSKDRARMVRLAEAYRARGGPSLALVDTWLAAAEDARSDQRLSRTCPSFSSRSRSRAYGTSCTATPASIASAAAVAADWPSTMNTGSMRIDAERDVRARDADRHQQVVRLAAPGHERAVGDRVRAVGRDADVPFVLHAALGRDVALHVVRVDACTSPCRPDPASACVFSSSCSVITNVPDHPPRFAHVDLVRPAAVVRELVLRQAPLAHLVAHVGRHRADRWR